MSRPLLELRGLRKTYPRGRRRGGGAAQRPAVDGVDLTVRPGRTLAVVGESGCGKSTLARMILRLAAPSAGEILLEGRNISEIPAQGPNGYCRAVQMVFQDPSASLDPRMTVARLVAEPLELLGLAPRAQQMDRVVAMLDRVGLGAEAAHRFPHEFSGGQRQRICIARALVCNPRLLVLDEPVSALDVSVQAQIINLMRDLQAELGLTYLFISHDLSVVRHMAEDIAVMRHGRIQEAGPADEVFTSPRSAYTADLLSAIPGLGAAPPGPALRRRLDLFARYSEK